MCLVHFNSLPEVYNREVALFLHLASVYILYSVFSLRLLTCILMIRRLSTHQDGEVGAWGSRASVDLLKVKGKGFTREKNKKKRGSYRGGAIDQHVSHSFKFDD